MLPEAFPCPLCKSNAVRRVHRRGFDRLMSLLGFRPFQCFTCEKRFYRRHYAIHTLVGPQSLAGDRGRSLDEKHEAQEKE